ncbi:hypothetical protein DDT52_02130 [Brenneria roseae subsp. roseae]|uniref:carbohydrate porin n=1 Tax=Brenneria roseae TaxID=1509241 RepID=UPI000D611607|nr:carbohydrate porin [Brenneria roseae]PWC23083.1 hypothetical protein DDT52_02130 [Brenneria roseae subsp. roseae]
MEKSKMRAPLLLAFLCSSACFAGVTFDTPQGKLSIGGNFEFNIDAAHINKDTTSGVDAYNNSGRVELNINGEHELEDGYYGAFSLNPGWQIYGDSINDQWMGVGKKNDWFLKLGHYLAYDVAPVGTAPGDDTWVGGYEMYTVNDARGRSNNMVTLSKDVNQAYYELTFVYEDDFSDHQSTLTTMPGQAVSGNYLYDGSGITINKKRDPLVARPVAAYNGKLLQAAVGGEFSMVTDAYETNEGVPLSKRNGVGGYVSTNLTDDLSGLVRVAYLDGVAHTQYTLGAGLKYKNIYLGYLYGHENVEKSDVLGIANNMQADAHEVYISSVWKDLLGLSNVEFHAGGYWSQVLANDSQSSPLAKPTDFGTRVRIKYWF